MGGGGGNRQQLGGRWCENLGKLGSLSPQCPHFTPLPPFPKQCFVPKRTAHRTPSPEHQGKGQNPWTGVRHRVRDAGEGLWEKPQEHTVYVLLHQLGAQALTLYAGQLRQECPTGRILVDLSALHAPEGILDPCLSPNSEAAGCAHTTTKATLGSTCGWLLLSQYTAELSAPARPDTEDSGHVWHT